MITKEERETIINFNEKESIAYIELPTRTKLHKRLLALGLEPKVGRIYDGQVAFDEFTFPKEWIKINPGRRLTDEQRARCSDRARKNFASAPTKE